MPAVRPEIIVNEIIDAIQQSGGVAAYISQSVRTHPRKFIFTLFGKSYELWVYIWTLTHGGRSSLPDEYRIQMTSVDSPLGRNLNPDGLTVLLGYHPDLKVFAGFDMRKHSTFTTGSPSVQINIAALTSALQNGLSFATKENDEIAIGIRPDQFLTYCLNAESLHIYGAEARLTQMLTRAVELQTIPEQDIAALSQERQLIVGNVSRLSRDANFRKVVLGAYENRCAVTRAQLRLVDAAHILPVLSSESSDHVTNGVALSPTFHRAYDNCLIYLDEEFIMRINTEKEAELRANRLDGGILEFKGFLDRRIHLPHDAGQRPNPEYIRLANKHRRIPGYV